MVKIPTVKTFCGCCDLKVSGVVIASFQIIGSFIAILIYLALFFVIDDVIATERDDELIESNTESTFLSKVIVVFWLSFSTVVAVVNILFSYWFIRGVTSKNPSKMKYYVIIVGIDAVIAAAQMNLGCFIIAAIEAYVFICSYSLYLECSSSFQADGVNTVIKNEQDTPPPPPPPPYDSCEKAGTFTKQYP